MEAEALDPRALVVGTPARQLVRAEQREDEGHPWQGDQNHNVHEQHVDMRAAEHERVHPRHRHGEPDDKGDGGDKDGDGQVDVQPQGEGLRRRCRIGERVDKRVDMVLVRC